MKEEIKTICPATEEPRGFLSPGDINSSLEQSFTREDFKKVILASLKVSCLAVSLILIFLWAIKN